MSQDDFWESLARGHAAASYPSSLDIHLSGNPQGEKFTSVRGLSDFGRKSGALDLPVAAGTMVVFAGDLGSVLSSNNPPPKGMPGEVVSVKSAGGDVTSHEGMVFVKWADGEFRSVHAEFLRLAPQAKQASHNRKFVDSIQDRNRFPVIDLDEYPPIRGMEGPFRFQGGRVLYYDPREGAYYDSKTDMYLDRNEKLARQAKSEDDPCWEGYEMFGQKEKDGRKVPNCIPQKKSSGKKDINPDAKDHTFETFKKKYFKGDPNVRPSVAKEFWDDFRYSYVGSLGSYIKDTTEDWSNGNPRLARTIRLASLGDLSQFLKTADGKLVHKSTKDLWSFKKDADGGLLLERLFDSNGKPLKI